MAAYSYVVDTNCKVEHTHIGNYIKGKNDTQHGLIIQDADEFWKLESGMYAKKSDEDIVWKLIKKSTYVGKLIDDMDGNCLGLVESDEGDKLRFETGGCVKKIYGYNPDDFDEPCEMTWKIRSDQKYKTEYKTCETEYIGKSAYHMGNQLIGIVEKDFGRTLKLSNGEMIDKEYEKCTAPLGRRRWYCV
jgi:hypothetical protein